MRRLRQICAAAAFALASPYTFAQAPLCLRAPSDAPISLHGMANFDQAGGGAQTMLYPMPGLAAAVAALATHAAINGVVRNSETERLRVQADAMLQPFQATLASYKQHELVKASLAQLKASGGKRAAPAGASAQPGETLVDSMPAFYMTPDQRALILDNAIAVLPHGATRPDERVIRVISPVQASDTNAAVWFAHDAALLRRISAQLLAQSIEIALNDLPAVASTGPFRTVRYPEGSVERMERAQVIGERCGQLVLRTLRGNLMAVPGPDDSACVPLAPQ
ncbi:MAG: hypothetical protein M3Y65_16195 [Pseudomonadota bacterium]|nr:hypothetical protein [Pseudomonadota bacterium]